MMRDSRLNSVMDLWKKVLQKHALYFLLDIKRVLSRWMKKTAEQRNRNQAEAKVNASLAKLRDIGSVTTLVMKKECEELIILVI